MLYKNVFIKILSVGLISPVLIHGMKNSSKTYKHELRDQPKQALLTTSLFPKTSFSNQIEQVLQRLIYSEQKGIWGACYHFDSQKLTEEWINNKKNRSYKLGNDALIVDNGHKANRGQLETDRQKNTLNKLARNGILVADNGIRYESSNEFERMHHKFFIFRQNLNQKQLLVTGSYNWTEKNQPSWENVVIIDEPETIAIFLEEWKTLIEHSELGDNKKLTNNVRTSLEQLSAMHMDVESIIPKAACSRDIQEVIVNLIDNEQEGIFGACFRFTTFDLAKLWVQKKIEGKLVVDNSYKSDNCCALKFLSDNKIEVNQLKKISTHELMHHKFFIFHKNINKNPIVVTGSFNWTGQARTNNWENIVILDDQNSVSSFFNEFQWLFANSEQIEDFHPIKNPSSTSIKINNDYIEPKESKSITIYVDQEKTNSEEKTKKTSTYPTCPQCQNDLKIIKHPTEPYAYCSSKKCDYQMILNKNSQIICPECQLHTLVLKNGKYGAFIGCSGYRQISCRYIYKNYF